LQFEPDERQRVVLEATASRGIFELCSRQWGKSTVVAVEAIHRAWSTAGIAVLVASPSRTAADARKRAVCVRIRSRKRVLTRGLHVARHRLHSIFSEDRH
jgi:hypothetical protein